MNKKNQEEEELRLQPATLSKSVIIKHDWYLHG